jgi:hypothetical protein
MVVGGKSPRMRTSGDHLTDTNKSPINAHRLNFNASERVLQTSTPQAPLDSVLSLSRPDVCRLCPTDIDVNTRTSKVRRLESLFLEN